MDKNNFIMSYAVDKTFESDKFLKISFPNNLF